MYSMHGDAGETLRSVLRAEACFGPAACNCLCNPDAAQVDDVAQHGHRPMTGPVWALVTVMSKRGAPPMPQMQDWLMMVHCTASDWSPELHGVSSQWASKQHVGDDAPDVIQADDSTLRNSNW